MEKYIYELKIKVRDYECDIQGIVNNSVYQNYLEYTRHEFMLEENVSFADLHNRGIDAVVARIGMDFKFSLRPGDECASRLYIKKEGIKYTFYQTIYRLPDEKLCIKAKVDCVAIVNGRLGTCKELDDLAEKTEKALAKE
jgi:acyl-CoA thioester hydrolase